MVELRSAAEIATIREAGRVVARTLAAVAAAARPGVRLTDLDEVAADLIAGAGAKPSFLGYHPSWAPTPYPAVLCLSVNEAVVHGIPDRRMLAEGDLLSIDCGAHVDGYHGVGTAMHEDPSVPNTGRAHRGLPLREGLVIAIEPMLIEGGGNRCRTRPDGWTVVTADGSRAAHAEHTVAVTTAGPVVLTAV
jgi:methionine aminopeptidase